jgi:hypothetical protein
LSSIMSARKSLPDPSAVLDMDPGRLCGSWDEAGLLGGL